MAGEMAALTAPSTHPSREMAKHQEKGNLKMVPKLCDIFTWFSPTASQDHWWS